MKIDTVAELEEQLSRPDDADASAMASLGGDLLILGVGGKMGPSLAAPRSSCRRESRHQTAHRCRGALQQFRFAG